MFYWDRMTQEQKTLVDAAQTHFLFEKKQHDTYQIWQQDEVTQDNQILVEIKTSDSKSYKTWKNAFLNLKTRKIFIPFLSNAVSVWKLNS